VRAVGVIGLGYWGPNLVRNLAASGRFRLAAICDRSSERLESVGAAYPGVERFTDPAALLAREDIQAVAIATPVATHAPLTLQALQAGKHVLVEKPMAASAAEAETMVAAAKAAGRVLLVDHIFLYSPPVRKLRELVVGGTLGDLLFIDSVRINLGLFQHDVNVVWDLAPHDLSIIQHLVDRPPVSVVAVGASHAGNGLEDVAYLHLDYGRDLHASVHVNWLSPVKIRHFLVGGSRHSVLYNDLDLSERIKIYDRGVDVSQDPEGRRNALFSYRSGDVLSPRLDNREPLRILVDHFADCIEKGTPPLTSGEHGLTIVRILDAAQESLRRAGARVELKG
jgi:predicted dehydrogenase